MIFHHIPKTNGRNFHYNTSYHIELEILKTGKQYKDMIKAVGHRPPATEEEGYTILREPISRTISHWLHIYYDRPKTKNDIFKFLVENPEDDLVNYQTKFLSHTKDRIALDEKVEGFTADIDLAKERLSNMPYVFDMNNLDYTKFRNILYSHFNLTPTYEWKDYSPVNKSWLTKELYEKLVPSEKSELEQLFKHDMELYYTTKYSEI